MKNREHSPFMTTDNQKNSRFPFVLAILSFIPYLGFILAPPLIVWGFFTKKKCGRIVTSIGMAGLLTSWLIAISLSYFVGLRQDNFHLDKHVKYILPDIVKTVEYFKIYEGIYPVSLDMFTPEKAQGDEIRLDQETRDRLYYEVSEGGHHYFLRGIGPDNKPFTADDIAPTIDPSSPGRVGLLIKR
jgi:hypothetical protein